MKITIASSDHLNLEHLVRSIFKAFNEKSGIYVERTDIRAGYGAKPPIKTISLIVENFKAQINGTEAVYLMLQIVVNGWSPGTLVVSFYGNNMSADRECMSPDFEFNYHELTLSGKITAAHDPELQRLIQALQTEFPKIKR